MRYHVCLICKGTGKVEGKPCEMCRKRWNSTRMDVVDTIRDEIQKAIPLGVGNDSLMFAGFDKGFDLESKTPLGILIQEFRCYKGKVL